MIFQMPYIGINSSESISEVDVSTLPLDEMLTQNFINVNIEKYMQKTGELNRVNDPINSSSPESLYLFQTRASAYNLEISLASALVKKGVTAIDTLVRS